MQNQIQAIIEKTRKKYTFKPIKNNVTDVIVQTILSQHTSDKNSWKAFEKLKKRFKKYEQILKEKDSELEKTIRSAGLSKIKTKRIKKALAELKKINLKELEKEKPSKIQKELTKISGVGPKTAAITLIFGMGKQAIPVDTHVFRVSKRLGIATGKTPAKAQEELEEKIPEKYKAMLHVSLISIGRTVCKPKNPKCEECILKKHCNYYKKIFQVKKNIEQRF
jgi:endonuclease-3